MGRFSGCLLACDIDGTIQINGVLPACNLKAIEDFKSEGGLVCLATGRTVSALSPVLEKYNGYAPCVICNGGMIYDTVNDKVLYEKVTEKSELLLARVALQAAPGIGIEAHCGKTVYTVNENQETIDHQTYENMQSTVLESVDDILSLKVNKLLYLFNNTEEQKAVKAAVMKGSSSAFYDTLVNIYGKDRRYLEQMPGGISKAQTLLRLAETLNIKRENLFVIGDNYNDMEMLETAAVSACPAEAPQEVKAIADYIVCSAAEGAVADFIELLKRRY